MKSCSFSEKAQWPLSEDLREGRGPLNRSLNFISVSHNFSTHLIFSLVNYSHSLELRITVQLSPLNWLTPGQDSRDKICGIAIRRLLKAPFSLLVLYIHMYINHTFDSYICKNDLQLIGNKQGIDRPSLK